ncbi:methyltransferase-like protein 27 [Periophthalmus magnuspinnatus]|uniref:Methyltransferase type 11 domain-containing protein n=1 Tax=Periophthalmus magnuspinnatus TaxID=409849 RepID=A0A3B4AAW1_9GOBI|nr:methyltransferase-like protein 27 [Periophthalmus magnuspinnatus]
MASSSDQFERVKAVILSCHEDTSAEEKINFYDTWAENYDQDVSVLEYYAPVFAAKTVSSHFTGARDTAVVLDVACGTGLVAKQLQNLGFRNFVGIDGSRAMLEMAKNIMLYQDLKLCMLGSQPLPFEQGVFDVVMIVGALSNGNVPVKVVRELCMVTKPGGYTCLTTRSNKDNLMYKTSLEQELGTLEKQGLWRSVQEVFIDQWERGITHHEQGYIPGAVYLYQKL